MRSLKIGFIGNFMPEAKECYSTECDRAWSFEKLGHTVVKFQENKTKANDILEAGRKLDVLFYSHTHGWEIKQLKEVFKRFKEAKIPTVSVHLDRWAWLEREKDIGTEATWFTQYIFMADASPEAIELYKEHNLNWYWLKPGVVERDCYLAQPDRQRFPHDIIFVGSKNYHSEYPFRRNLVEWLHLEYGDSFGHYGNDGLGVVRGHDLNVLFASAKIVVGDSCFGGRPYYWSDRVTETIGRGGVLLHPFCVGMGEMPILKYDCKDFDSIEQKIDYYLKNETFREMYRKYAHEYVKKHETYTNRAQEMLNVIFDEDK